MTEALELSKPLHERVYERIRDSIGDLMTDDDLKLLVDQAAQKAFFEPIREKPDSFSSYTIEKPPILVTKIKELLDSKITEAAQQWVKEHPEEINKVIDEKIGEGFTKIIAQTIDNKMQNALWNFGEQFKKQLGS